MVAAGTTAGGQAAVSAGSGTEEAAWVLVAKASAVGSSYSTPHLLLPLVVAVVVGVAAVAAVVAAVVVVVVLLLLP